MEKNELKLCPLPLCRGRANMESQVYAEGEETIYWTQICCEDCGLELSKFEDEEAVAKLWNTRQEAH
jgi:hypothetical protein